MSDLASSANVLCQRHDHEGPNLGLPTQMIRLFTIRTETGSLQTVSETSLYLFIPSCRSVRVNIKGIYYEKSFVPPLSQTTSLETDFPLSHVDSN